MRLASGLDDRRANRERHSTTDFGHPKHKLTTSSPLAHNPAHSTEDTVLHNDFFSQRVVDPFVYSFWYYTLAFDRVT